MESKNTILQELAQISQGIANISNRNVYSVPAGYFDNLPAQVLAKVNAGNVAAGSTSPMPYSVPDGYFDGLAGNIMAKIKTQAAPQSSEIFFDAPVKEAFLPQGLPTPYSVPQGYFNSLSTEVISKIKIQHISSNEDINSEAFLPYINMPYAVPQGYFDNLAGKVMAKIKAQNTEVYKEAEDVAFLLKTIGRQMPYGLPQGYFEGLAGNVITKINAAQNAEIFEEVDEASPLLNTIGKQMPYSVPLGYFDGLAGNITTKIKAQQNREVFEELEQIAPLLNTIGKQMPYRVPQGYFNTLVTTINAQTTTVEVEVEETGAKIITMNAGSKTGWVKWAAAACAAVLIGVGGFFYNRQQPAVTTGEKSVSVEKMLASVSAGDINDYLNSQPSTGAEAQPTSLEDQVPDVQTDIDETSTQDIQQYLQDNSGPDEKKGKDI